MRLYRLLAVALAAAVIFTRVDRWRTIGAGIRAGAPMRRRSTRCTSDRLAPRRCRDASPTSRSTRPTPRSTTSPTAHGGVWKTTTTARRSRPCSRRRGRCPLATSRSPQSNPDLVWVGSGESSNRQSVSWGDGVYKSTDGGKTFANVGLRTSKAHQPHRDRPARQQHRLRRRDGQPVGTGRRARHLQDDRRRHRPGSRR